MLRGLALLGVWIVCVGCSPSLDLPPEGEGDSEGDGEGDSDSEGAEEACAPPVEDLQVGRGDALVAPSSGCALAFQHPDDARTERVALEVVSSDGLDQTIVSMSTPPHYPSDPTVAFVPGSQILLYLESSDGAPQLVMRDDYGFGSPTVVQPSVDGFRTSSDGAFVVAQSDEQQVFSYAVDGGALGSPTLLSDGTVRELAADESGAAGAVIEAPRPGDGERTDVVWVALDGARRVEIASDASLVEYNARTMRALVESTDPAAVLRHRLEYPREDRPAADLPPPTQSEFPFFGFAEFSPDGTRLVVTWLSGDHRLDDFPPELVDVDAPEDRTSLGCRPHGVYEQGVLCADDGIARLGLDGSRDVVDPDASNPGVEFAPGRWVYSARFPDEPPLADGHVPEEIRMLTLTTGATVERTSIVRGLWVETDRAGDSNAGYLWTSELKAHRSLAAPELAGWGLLELSTGNHRTLDPTPLHPRRVLAGGRAAAFQPWHDCDEDCELIFLRPLPQ